jgi:hypothetical protein
MGARGFHDCRPLQFDRSLQKRFVNRLGLGHARRWVPVRLASILSRDESGRSMTNAAIVSNLESGPVLAGTKLIAEA